MKIKIILLFYLIASHSLISCKNDDGNKKTEEPSGWVTVGLAIAKAINYSEAMPYIVIGASVYFVGNAVVCGISAYQCHQKSKCKMELNLSGCSCISE